MPNSGKKPKVSYLDNLAKAAGKLRDTYAKASDYADRAKTYPPNALSAAGKGREYFGKKATAERNKQDKAMGQVLGAALQGRRYDSKGKQIKK